MQVSIPAGIPCPQIAQKASGRGMNDTFNEFVPSMSLGASETDMTLSFSRILIWYGLVARSDPAFAVDLNVDGDAM